MFLAGFGLETVADATLARFRADPANRGRVLTSGVFAWSRHPHYFGEILVWWALGVLAWSLSGSLLAFVGPVVITLLLLKVSGVPMTESILRDRPGYADYAARVPALVPRPPARAVSRHPAAGE